MVQRGLPLFELSFDLNVVFHMPILLKDTIDLQKFGPDFFKRACLITLHSIFEIFLKGHPAAEVMIDRRIFER